MTVPAPNATPTINPDECRRLGRKVNDTNVFSQLRVLNLEGPAPAGNRPGNGQEDELGDPDVNQIMPPRSDTASRYR